MQNMNRSSHIFRPIRNNSNSSQENSSLPDDNDNYIHIPILCCSGCTSGSGGNNHDNDILDVGDADDRLPSRMRSNSSNIRNDSMIPNRTPIIKPRFLLGPVRNANEEEENVESNNNNNTVEHDDFNIEEDEDMDIQEQRHVPDPPSDDISLDMHSIMTELQEEAGNDGGNRTRDVTTPPPETSSSIQDDVEYVSKRFDVNDFLSFIPLPRNHKRMRSFTEAEKRRRIQFFRNSGSSSVKGNKEAKRNSSVNKAA